MTSTTTKENFVSFIVAAHLQFRGLVHYHGGQIGSMQADMVLEKELRVLHLDSRAIGSGLYQWAWLEHI